MSLRYDVRLFFSCLLTSFRPEDSLRWSILQEWFLVGNRVVFVHWQDNFFVLTRHFRVNGEQYFAREIYWKIRYGIINDKIKAERTAIYRFEHFNIERMTMFRGTFLFFFSYKSLNGFDRTKKAFNFESVHCVRSGILLYIVINLRYSVSNLLGSVPLRIFSYRIIFYRRKKLLRYDFDVIRALGGQTYGYNIRSIFTDILFGDFIVDFTL